jgi:acylphosphatase
LGAKLIKITDMIEFNLRQQGITVASVLKAGQTLRLHSVANIGGGGESRDVSEIMHPDFSGIAVKARKAVFGVPYAGVDLLAEDITKAPHEQRWMVIEVNTNPDLALHHFPSEGAARDAAGAIVEHLFPEILATDTPLEKSVKVVVKGKVHDVGFVKWVWRNAHLHVLAGWVRSNPDGSVESLFHGAPNAVDHMVSLCKTGPKRAVVDDLTVHPQAVQP